MASKNKLAAAKYGYGTIGADVFFSIADIHRFGDIIANIQRNDEAKEYAIRDLMYLHDKLIDTISNSEDSVFTPDKVESYEIDNRDIE